MALILGFTELVGAVLLLTKAIVPKATWADILGGRAAQVYRETAAVAPSAAAGAGATGVPSAAAVNAATGAGGTAVGEVSYKDLNAIAKAHGWGASEIAAWVAVIVKESGGSSTAQNPTSNAYGIAQFINGASEYASYGGNSTTVIGQLTSMANYIAQRYGTPTGALAHENSAGWY
jgi:hypothetical protein